MSTETIYFKSPLDKTIVLDTTKCIRYFGTTTFDEDLAKKQLSWHQIIVQNHKRKYSKEQILKALFDTVENNYFFPIAYHPGERSDKFLVRKCFNALQKLFQKKLLLNMPDRQNLQITVKLNVGTYQVGQINPESKIYKALLSRFEHLTVHNNVDNVLNLEKFSLSPELSDVHVNLGNQFVFNCLCEFISKEHEHFNAIDGINLSNNNIKYLSPMTLFAKANIKMIDLRLNNLRYMKDIEYLKCINFTDLYISGNLIEQTETDFYEKLKKSLPQLLETDVINSKKNSSVNTPLQIDSVTVEQNGTHIEVHDLISLDRFKNSDSWHKLTIEHQGKYTKKEITEAIFEFFARRKPDIEFFPCYYNSGPSEDSFLVRKCHENLRLLIENELKLSFWNVPGSLKIKLIMDVAMFKRGHVEQSEIILSAASERFNIMDRCLNLENLKSSKTLKDLTLNMGNSVTLYQILLHCGRKYSSNIVEIRLNNNNISSCKALRILDIMKNLKVLDLRDNSIKTINDLENIPRDTIMDIRLDGNPLCGKFSTSSSYIKAFKKLLPSINKLDGILISSESDFVSRKNYLCEIKYYDLVEQFVSNYFKAYDSITDRTNMIGMYHSDAIFTISFNCTIKNILVKHRTEYYDLKQRNLISLSDLNKVYRNIYIGHDQISSVLKNFPKTKHNFLSLTTDTSIVKENLISITVTGVFKDIPKDETLENDILLAFSRTFIIRPTETETGNFNYTTEYKILNDHLHISNPTQFQTKKFHNCESSVEIDPIVAATSYEKELFTVMFEKTVGLKRVWCTKCLNDGNWNFKEALEIFMKFVSENKIPETAFIESLEN